MKKIIRIFLIFIFVILLSSCGFDRVSRLEREMAESTAFEEEQIQGVIDAFKEHDTEKLKSYFSISAVNQDSELESKIDAILNIIGEHEISYEQRVSTERTNTHYGEKEIIVRSWYLLDIDSEQYTMYLYYYREATENPENLGIYMMQFIPSDKETEETNGILCPGIYMLPTTEEPLDAASDS